MKKIIILLFLILTFSPGSGFGELSCSQNGAKVFYINGILTAESKNKEDTEVVFEIFDKSNELNKLDSNVGPLKKTDFIGIHNPTFGIINDAAELFAQQYYIKNGNNKNAQAVFYAMRRAPDLFIKTASKFIPNPIVSSLVGAIPLTATINYASMHLIAQEASQKAFENSLRDVDDLLIENDKLITSTKKIFNEARLQRKKMLLVAHSQGNAVLQATLKNIEMTDPVLDEYIKKYSGVMHVASPVIPKQEYKNNSIRYSGDLVIGPLGFLDNILPLPPAPLTHKIIKKAGDISGHLFFDTYLSNIIQVRKIAGGEPEPSRQVFKDNMINLAEKIDDNCDAPNIKIEVAGAVVDPNDSLIFNYKLNTFFENKTSINFKDLNDTDDSTVFEVSYSKYNFYYISEAENYKGYSVDSKFVSNVKSIADFDIPFSLKNYWVDVKATNKFGVTSEIRYLIYTEKDTPPTFGAFKEVCALSGRTPGPDGKFYRIQLGSTIDFGFSDVDSERVNYAIYKNGAKVYQSFGEYGFYGRDFLASFGFSGSIDIVLNLPENSPVIVNSPENAPLKTVVSNCIPGILVLDE